MLLLWEVWILWSLPVESDKTRHHVVWKCVAGYSSWVLISMKKLIMESVEKKL